MYITTYISTVISNQCYNALFWWNTEWSYNGLVCEWGFARVAANLMFNKRVAIELLAERNLQKVIVKYCLLLVLSLLFSTSPHCKLFGNSSWQWMLSSMYRCRGQRFCDSIKWALVQRPLLTGQRIKTSKENLNDNINLW